jgi:type II secretory pathway pseudopilin PulG
MIAMLILVMVVFSLTYILVNSLADTAYARQRSEATVLANQAIEEIRSLPWSTIEKGMNPSPLLAPDTTIATDTNIVGNCFEGSPLDIDYLVGTQACTTNAWRDPTCLTRTGLQPPPSASSLTSPQPISPHEACYLVGTKVYGVDVYITGLSGTSYLAGSNQALTATVVVTWARPFRNGLSDHVVTTTELSNCLKGGSPCASS